MRRITRLTSHMFMALLEGALVATLMVGLVAGTAFAAKGGGHGGKPGGGAGTGGTIALVMVTDMDGNGTPNYGDAVTFNISTTATTQPWVNLQCSQNGVLMAQGWNGFFVGSITGRNFGLYSPQWTGGAADCTAYLTTPQWAVLASTSFHVDP
jgi:hypothetical protein